jgi:hypothetical protein
MFDWQTLTVGLIIAAACFYLARRWWSRSPEGGSCGKCGAAQTPAAKRVTLVELQGLKRK